jgi:protein-L-isoaspartate(D-aspartate) O-methyltransferase
MSMHNEDSGFQQTRRQMLDQHLRGRGITDPDVLRVMAEIPRERFVSEQERDRAYADNPLPIGQDQTISQPYIVALMTQLLRLHRDCEVLEVGTGSGYQTALLARLARRVYTIERHPDLSVTAQDALAGLDLDNVEFHVGDGSCGWPVDRTFDRIIITAAVPDFPPPVAAQLIEGGIIVAPVGQRSVQQLIKAEKFHGKLIEDYACSCRFVHLIGEHGFPE